jgi:hypothetical protein
MEAMTLLSGVAAAAIVALPTHAEVSSAAKTRLTLGGKEHGGFVAHRTSTSRDYTVAVAGTLTPIGKAAVTGTLDVALVPTSGPPSGTLHLVTSKGSLTLKIPESVAIPYGLPAPTSKGEVVDTYYIAGGTGAYKGDTGSGVVEFTFNAKASAGAYQAGQVTITFTTLAPPPSLA